MTIRARYPGRKRQQRFWRAHYPDCPPFSPENASSAGWSETLSGECAVCGGSGDVECTRCHGEGCERCDWTGFRPCATCEGDGKARRVEGYSCCTSRERLVQYFAGRGGLPDDCPIVIFTGRVVGFGQDGEPLVVPQMTRPRPRWTSWSTLTQRGGLKK